MVIRWSKVANALPKNPLLEPHNAAATVQPANNPTNAKPRPIRGTHNVAISRATRAGACTAHRRRRAGNRDHWFAYGASRVFGRSDGRDWSFDGPKNQGPRTGPRRTVGTSCGEPENRANLVCSTEPPSRNAPLANALAGKSQPTSPA